MRFFDFFAGIGGFRLGMEMAGHECVGHCEIDKFANMSYVAMHRPKESEVFFDDIRTVDPWDMPECDIYCGGFPCQSFSIAGLRRGFEDTRGTLFFEIMRIAKERHPKYLFLENVKGLLSHNGGSTFQTIIETMEELGYSVEWQVLNSRYYVPQNRERVFIVGHFGEFNGDQIFPITKGTQQTDKLQGHSYNTQVVANTLDTRIEARARGTYPTSGGGIIKVNGYHKRAGNENPTSQIDTSCDIGVFEQDGELIQARRFTPRECFRLQGFPDEYFERARSVCDDSQLYKQAENSVTVNVIYEIAKGFKE